MRSVFFFLRRAVAIALGGTLTAYSAWASWTHSHDVLGSLAAVSAAVLLALCERAWHDRQVIRLVLLGMLGITAAVFSGSVVLERIAHAQATRLSASRTDNLPRLEAERALAEAKKSLAAAEAEARDECRSGRKLRCEATESREKAARARVADARAKLVSLGAVSVETPVASVLGEWTETYHRVMPLALPLWLELAAPIVRLRAGAPQGARAAEEEGQAAEEEAASSEADADHDRRCRGVAEAQGILIQTRPAPAAAGFLLPRLRPAPNRGRMGLVLC